jgi:hypothetical protein
MFTGKPYLRRIEEMKKRTRIVLIILLAVFLIFGGLAAYGLYRFYLFFGLVTAAKEIPPELKDVRVLKGQDFLKKAEFFKLDSEGTFTTIKKSASIKDEKERQRYVQSQTAKAIYGFEDLKVIGQEIIAVGAFGAYVLDFNGARKRFAAFEPSARKVKIGPYETESYDLQLENLRIVQLDANQYGFLTFSSFGGVQVFDQNAQSIWAYGKREVSLGSVLKDEKEQHAEYEKSAYVLEAAVGDLNGDGISEYIVAMKKDGIHAFDREGHEEWFQPDDFPYERLEVRDLDGDGKNELIQIGRAVRNAEGLILRETKGGSNDAVLFATTKDKKIALQYCNIYRLALTCQAENSDYVLRGTAPLSDVKLEKPRKLDVPGSEPITFDSESASNLHAVCVHLRKDKPAYLAVVASFIGIPRANFYVYDSSGTLVYHELLPETAETIAVLAGENGVEQLLVGGHQTIWKYGD